MSFESGFVPAPEVNVGEKGRRRTCVICGTATPNTYVTSFTRVLEKQEEWVTILANGDSEFADDLKTKLAAGRKYLCLDHFDQDQLTARRAGDGIEIVRNSVPLPFKNTEFVRNRHEAFRNEIISIPEKRRKKLNGLEGKGALLNAQTMAFLMSTVNFYVEKAMADSDQK